MPATALARSALTRVPAPVLAVLLILAAVAAVAVSVFAASRGVVIHHAAMFYGKNKMFYG